MKNPRFIALDVHCHFTYFVADNPGGKIRERGEVRTGIPELSRVIKRVPRPRVLVMEEGPLTSWLVRNLGPLVDQVISADPWRNRLIAKDGDKDDLIDAEKLLKLARGGFLREVHQSESEGRQVFKQHVGVYQDRVRERVRVSHQAIWYLRRFGVMAVDADLCDPKRRAELLGQLPSRRTVRGDLEYLLEAYDLALSQVERLREDLVRLAKRIPEVARLTQVPGVAWIRAATFYAYVDTPWRFRSKQALWKYMGIGLERHQSGDGPEHLGVPQRCNRVLKDMILGAAESAAGASDGPFAEAYQRYLRESGSARIARRNVARTIACVLWGMWKSGGEYRADWVGVEARKLAREP